ncbi:MAG: hypothetical protein JXA25_15775 [Anaerolineales bacterium]|nr:hypothetical protein [Anaerolineales bacterium]
MNKMAQQNKEQIASPALMIIPAILFFGLLQFKFPPAITQVFLNFSPLLFLIALGLLILAYSAHGHLRTVCVLSLILALFALTLSYKWASGHSDAISFGGTIPYKDAFNYYNGARFILKGDRIPGSRWQAAWRPLFPGFFASLLLFTRQNLKWALALLNLLVGWSTFLAAEQIFRTMGRFAAAAFAVLIYLFFQPIIGVPLTEAHGLLLGSLGFLLLWYSARHANLIAFLSGILVLMTAVSSRAGAFFIFPMLILWSGIAFKKDQRYNLKIAALAAGVCAGSFLLVNNVFSWVYVADGPGKEIFGNFTNTLYGQVMGGTGWGSIGELAGEDVRLLYRLILQEFLNHPMGLLSAAAQSYRNFFYPNQLGIFSFYSSGELTRIDTLLWYGGLVILGLGIFRLFRRHDSFSSLLLFVFLGIILSVPFLPPRDGGNRFYASTMPFFFAIVAAGLALKQKGGGNAPAFLSLQGLLLQSGVILFLTLAAPLGILLMHHKKELKPEALACPDGQTAFAFQLYEGSYIDIHPDNQDCGLVPDLCLQDFDQYGTEKGIDPFYGELVATASSWPDEFRIAPANDLINGGIHFFAGSSTSLTAGNSENLVSGCANTSVIKSRSLYLVPPVEEQ